jgi:hypothetical protein
LLHSSLALPLFPQASRNCNTGGRFLTSNPSPNTHTAVSLFNDLSVRHSTGDAKRNDLKHKLVETNREVSYCLQ